MKENIIKHVFITLLFLLSISYCHAFQQTNEVIYPSPSAIVPSKDSKTIFVGEENSCQIKVISIKTGTIKKILPLPGQPSGLTISTDGKYLFATLNSASGIVVKTDIDTGRTETIRTVKRGINSPLLFGNTIGFCSRFENTFVLADYTTRNIIKTIKVPREPVAATATANGKFIFIANHLPLTASTSAVIAASITVIDGNKYEVITNILLPNGSTCLRGICTSPDEKYVYATHSLAKFQLPTTQLDKGWMNTSVFSIIDAVSRKLVATVPLDDFDSGTANPWGITCSTNGRLLAICHAGTHEISIINLPQLHKKIEQRINQTITATNTAKSIEISNDLTFLHDIRKRIKLSGNGPRHIAALDETTFIVGEYFSDSVEIINYSETNQKIKCIKLGNVPILTNKRKGEIIFNDATFCYQQWQSCASCHPDGRADGLNWDLLNDGLGNPKNTKSLVLAHATPPAMISGIRESAEKAVRSGFKYILFQNISEENAECVDEYLKSLLPEPSPLLINGNLSELAQKGKKIFEKADCARCHPPPFFTDCKSYNIGLNPPTKFDTPTLIENWRTAPYLYDGRAQTMYEVLTKFNTNNMHGKTKELPEDEFEALIEYLLSL